MWKWYENGGSSAEYPENPYARDSQDYQDWETGFDDAIAYLESTD